MKKGKLVWLATCAFLILCLSPAMASGPVQGPPTGAPAVEGKERHPAIHAAIRDLEQAKAALEKARGDFGGHRARAIEHVNQALAECRAALQYGQK